MLGTVSSDEAEYLIKVSCDSGVEGKVKKIILDYIESKKIILKDIKIHKGRTKTQPTVIDAVLLSKRDKRIEDIVHKIAKDSKINGILWEMIKG
jgi:hypothetical protein